VDIAKRSIAAAAQAEASDETAATIQVKAAEEETSTAATIQVKAAEEETTATIQVEACNRKGDSSNHPGGGTRGDSSSH
jgi:hypothetical protein